MARYKIEKCNNCDQKSRRVPTMMQNIIASLLFTLLIIPGVIYWFFSLGKACYMCGIKYKDSK